MNKLKLLFIHHSVGGNLIKEGNLRECLKKLDPTIEFLDHGYNLYPLFPVLFSGINHHTGLRDGEGRVTGRDYNIILSNNSPKEYADIFSRDSGDFTLKSILAYDVIAFKNCYPTTQITSDKQLTEDRKYYTMIRDYFKNYPKKQFILLTPPPARKEMTTLENAQRAGKLIDWLISKEFLKGVSNLYVFDLFGLLSDEKGYLKEEYERFLPWDSHPNKKANEIAAPIFAKYLVEKLN